MAAKKKAASKPAGAKKPAAKKKKAAASAPDTGGVVSQTGSTAGIGHNTKVPAAKDLAAFKKRLDKLHEEKAEKNAAFMADIKAVYGEMASKFGVSRKIARMFYAKGRSEEAFAEAMAEFETKESEDFDRLTLAGAKAFGEDTGFGAWLNAQVRLGELGTPGDAEEEDDDVLETQPATIVKPQPLAEAMKDAIEADTTTKH